MRNFFLLSLQHRFYSAVAVINNIIAKNDQKVCRDGYYTNKGAKNALVNCHDREIWFKHLLSECFTIITDIEYNNYNLHGHLTALFMAIIFLIYNY